MKSIVNILRILTGLLFIFSGLIKANDPLGLGYKMDEYFTVWNWHWASPFSLYLSIGMNVLEIVAGVALLLGWAPKFITRLLLVLMVFFTFLTGYAVLSGKIKTCGCFGDCVPLQAWQSFVKDLVLTAIILVLVWKHEFIKAVLPLRANLFAVLFSTGMVFFGQLNVLKHLPYVDCLPYAAGKNLLQQMDPPPGSIPDSVAIFYTYRKAGQNVVFDAMHFPTDFDESSYEYVSREEKVVRKGNAEPAIKDFALYNSNKTDTTRQLLQASGKQLLFVAKDFNGYKPEWQELFVKLYTKAREKSIPFFIVSNQPGDVEEWFNQTNHFNIPVLTCDGTVLKTMLRSKVGVVALQGATVAVKWSDADMNEAVKWMNGL
ncbi:MAG: DoxX family protein [Bacteroidetes bacterium]|uniref:BT_3928 family protein n=1 Tax=Phnomibacter sp. TaxID=2836217 RepID=UPI002FDE46DA|nr:DoxX family protein [Bacteroidota bacterium]